jgi:hypothetical protein
LISQLQISRKHYVNANHGTANSEAFLDFGGQISGRRSDA